MVVCVLLHSNQEISKIKTMTTNSQEFTRANKQDVYNHPDYYLLDELLSEEHKLIRSAVRDYVKKELSPIIF